ncbi:MAG TPA: transketolase [Candidatus Pacebacteria bacterium]|nr:MAG: hypothetical protein UX00_C0002G0035 [Microgenomates group bacterium GW2011_GWB1_45_17]KKU23111.1 MAG: hypothetical protein UX35_C0010G0029 [Microgenomates group bacterium GW2011_GWA1_46_15]KKU23774.1 MAG: transketolase [Microgenomates group bacterium GW2011_GWC1_46_15]HAV15048.1 transketolase [Candidatus Paceibacterota bacterium]HCR11695.1 transketolase [Candidatus Paceibacterota bacterium]
MPAKTSFDQLVATAKDIRKDIIEMLFTAGSGHSAGSLGMADVFTALYFSVLSHQPDNPWWEDRDRLLVSNGHICPVWYATLARASYFAHEELFTLRKFGSRLQGHPVMHELPGIENTSGSLGQGISQAVGVALAAKLQHKTYHTFCIMGDGEQDEGEVWEAYSFAAAHTLTNLTVIMDRNMIQSEGYTEHILPLEPLRSKLYAFGWDVMEVDGHDIPQLIHVLREAKSAYLRPTVVIAHTIPGKGVDFMEGKYDWHAQPPRTVEEARTALNDLQTLQGKIDHD